MANVQNLKDSIGQRKSQVTGMNSPDFNFNIGTSQINPKLAESGLQKSGAFMQQIISPQIQFDQRALDIQIADSEPSNSPDMSSSPPTNTMMLQADTQMQLNPSQFNGSSSKKVRYVANQD